MELITKFLSLLCLFHVLVSSLPAEVASKHRVTRAHVPAVGALDRRSGDTYALTWVEWQFYLQKVDELLQNNRAASTVRSRKIKIYIWGGLAAVAAGARGPQGKTEDADFVFDGILDTNQKTALWTAIRQVQNTYSDKLAPDWMNDDPEHFLSSDAIEDTEKNAENIPGSTIFSGVVLQLIVAPSYLQLVQKMNRLCINVDNNDHQPKDLNKWWKDMYDSIRFLWQTASLKNSLVTFTQLEEYQKITDTSYNAEEMAEMVSGAIQAKYAGFDDSVISKYKGTSVSA